MRRYQLLRFATGVQSSLGHLFAENERALLRPLCFTLEDERRETKVVNETRIPAGEYDLALRTEGGMHPKYAARFPDMHRGMVWLKDVPGFEWIYLHVGLDDTHTSGCILVGDGAQQNATQRGRLERSAEAYQRVYPGLAESIVADRTVLKIIDYA